MKIMFIFPGYGSQYVGMGKEIYDSSRLMQELFEQASSCLDTNFVKLCFASSDAELSKMGNAYPALFLVASSINLIVNELGIYPDAVAGYASGELAALFAAKSLNLPDGLYLLAKLTSFYSYKLNNDLLRATRVLNLSSQQVDELLAETAFANIFVSHYQDSQSHIVSGLTQEILNFEKLAKSHHAKVKSVPLAHGLQSSMAEDVLVSFKPYMAKVDIKDLSVPLISNQDSKIIKSGDKARERIFQSITQPVKWTKVIEKIKNYDLILEIGPQSSYLESIKKAFPQKMIYSISKPEDLELCKELYQKTLHIPV